jgi:hypothetical protein
VLLALLLTPLEGSPVDGSINSPPGSNPGGIADSDGGNCGSAAACENVCLGGGGIAEL